MRRLLLAMGMSLVVAAPAEAATVGVVSTCTKYDCSHVATFSSARGESDDVAIAYQDHAYTFRDARNPIEPGHWCEAVDERTVRCQVPPGPRFESLYAVARLGDGDDVAVADQAALFGGPGDDRLEGAHGSLVGGPGADVVRAAGPGTELIDGDGPHPARDRYIGAGDTTLSYHGRRGPVRVDLRRPGRSGAAGEADVASGIRNVTGGRGDDVLLGDAAGNRLEGGAGADRLEGGGGNDLLRAGAFVGRPGPQRDILRGGPGRDRFDLKANDIRGAARRVSCGAGRDTVSETRPADRIAPGCERVRFGLQDLRLRAVLRRARAPFAVSVDCLCRRGRFQVRTGGRTIAAARARNRRVALRLNALGRRLLAARPSLRVAVIYREYGSREGFSTRLSLLRHHAAERTAPLPRPG